MATAKNLDNEWNQPYHVYGPGEGKLRRRILRQVGDYRIDQKEWQAETKETEKFLGNLTSKICENSGKFNSEFQVSRDYVKQASGRQGLKINSPDEFDIVVPIHLTGLDIQQAKVRNSDGKIMAGLHRQRVLNKDMSTTHPRLSHEGVFQRQGGNVFLNSKSFHEKVWTGIVDKALEDVRKDMPNYKIVRSVHPPTVNVQITSPTGRVINYDVVPGVSLKTETIRIPEKITGKQAMVVNLPIFALPKHDNKNSPVIHDKDRSLIWRNDTSSHERCMADLCKNSDQRRYIMTASRILKSAIKTLQEEQNHLGHLINSYHLKTIAYKTVYDLTMRDSKRNLTGVKDALGHQITALNKCVSERYLNDFFQGNEDLEKIFPGSELTKNHRQQNLFWKANPNLMMSARYGIPKLTGNLNGCFTCINGQ
ncbi:uncharacterized protein LOC134229596 [Saccostrea cucullata]|uniref:uncharacterized protein LOC134229596 n=1 Tax=Saccostrea cuccullata TaxID=36930 RepID=UPI002ED40247